MWEALAMQREGLGHTGTRRLITRLTGALTISRSTSRQRMPYGTMTSLGKPCKHHISESQHVACWHSYIYICHHGNDNLVRLTWRMVGWLVLQPCLCGGVSARAHCRHHFISSASRHKAAWRDQAWPSVLCQKGVLFSNLHFTVTTM
jgi:hypothetical protein